MPSSQRKQTHSGCLHGAFRPDKDPMFPPQCAKPPNSGRGDSADCSSQRGHSRRTSAWCSMSLKGNAAPSRMAFLRSRTHTFSASIRARDTTAAGTGPPWRHRNCTTGRAHRAVDREKDVFGLGERLRMVDVHGNMPLHSEPRLRLMHLKYDTKRSQNVKNIF
jgi:hypothetical protein